MRNPTWAAAGILGIGVLAAACSSSSSTPATSASSGASAAATSAPAASSAAAAGAAVLKTAKTSLGTLITNSKGFTVYTFAKDTSTTSACSGACAQAWPPVTGTPQAASGITLSGKLGTITRSDGTPQATYNGHPLYLFSGDSAAGQTSGNGSNAFGALWSVVTIGGGAAPSASASPAGGGGGY
jgi:predicted lipoprotein with Yx(FWY)xxD motif